MFSTSRLVTALRQRPGRAWLFGISVGVALAAIALVSWKTARGLLASDTVAKPSEAAPPTPAPSVKAGPRLVTLDAEQQEAVGLVSSPVEFATVGELVTAPGRIVPDEQHYAFITPRAPGVIRTVHARVGQKVRAGDLLATIDSQEVAQARLNLVTASQALEIAQTRLQWQERIYRTTLELIEHLEASDSPDEIHERFEGRPVGVNRDRLITAYAQFRLARTIMERSRRLAEESAIPYKQYQVDLADFEAAQAAYQALMDSMGFEAELAYSKAQQEVRQAETAVRVAQEQLRVLGVRPDGTEPKVEQDHVVDVQPDGTLPAEPDDQPESVKVEAILPPTDTDEPAVEPIGAEHDDPSHESRLISTYSIWAPFDGTILERATIVPGVAVSKDERLFTMADLSQVWVEVHIPESDFDQLARSLGARVELASPAYPGRSFPAEVIYSGDLVDPQTMAVQLLARAENLERLLKPGMFVNVALHSPGTRTAALVPTSALQTEEDRTFVYVRRGPDRFERVDIEAGPADGPQTAVYRGLEPGDEVVVEGAFALQAKVSNGEVLAARTGE